MHWLSVISLFAWVGLCPDVFAQNTHGIADKQRAAEIEKHLSKDTLERVRFFIKELKTILSEREDLLFPQQDPFILTKIRAYRQRIDRELEQAPGLLKELDGQPSSKERDQVRARISNIHTRLPELKQEALDLTFAQLAQHPPTKKSILAKMKQLEDSMRRNENPTSKELQHWTETFEGLGEETIYLTRQSLPEGKAAYKELEALEAKFQAKLDTLSPSQAGESPRYRPVPPDTSEKAAELERFHPSKPTGDPIQDGVQQLMRRTMIPVNQ